MRFWLRWAIVTLPVVACISLWIRSYRANEMLLREGHHNLLQVGSRIGSIEIVFMRDSEWKPGNGRWDCRSFPIVSPTDRLTQHRFLGFGAESIPGPTPSDVATAIEAPIWFLTLLALVPPIWLYRRHRNRRTTGFPVGSLDSETTGSA